MHISRASIKGFKEKGDEDSNEIIQDVQGYKRRNKVLITILFVFLILFFLVSLNRSYQAYYFHHNLEKIKNIQALKKNGTIVL